MIPTHRHRLLLDLALVATDLNDQVLLAAVRRLIEADRLGWSRYSTREDRNLCMNAAEDLL